MRSDIPEFDILNSCLHLNLRRLEEPRDNSLRILVQEAVINREGISALSVQTSEFNALLTDYSTIESTPNCQTFELQWPTYVAYFVTEECVGSVVSRDDECFDGNVLRVYSRSRFLDYVAHETAGHTDIVRHYKLICLNHLIDVASYAPPEIRILTPNGAEPTIVQ